MAIKVAAGTQMTVRVTPKASRNRVVEDGDILRVYVTVVPENGKANAAVLKLLSKTLDIPKSRLKILRGDSSRDKVIAIL